MSVTLDKSSQIRFQKAIQKLVALSDEPVEDIMRSQGRLFAVDAAKFTARFGDKPKAGMKHKQNVDSLCLQQTIY